MMSRAVPPYPEAVLAAIRAGEVAGRLPGPSADRLADTFPFETAITVVPVADPVLPEPDRPGEHDASDCRLCARPDADYLWTDVEWRLRSWRREGLLSLILESRPHVDLNDLDDAQAGDLGRQIVRIERVILSAIDGVGRVHVHRWGDGLAHLHVWFLIRPAGFAQFRGSALEAWLDVLPALPDDIWRAYLARIADGLRR